MINLNSADEIQASHDATINSFHCALLVIALAAAIGLGYLAGVQYHSLKIGLGAGAVSALANWLIIWLFYKFTVGRGAPASMVDTTIIIWFVMSIMCIGLCTALATWMIEFKFN